MSIDVSVVVPVYNPGRYIEACIDGYLSQRMPPSRREIIFVDDGSTDGTPERLDRLAAEHEDVTTIHQPNSGWPGKPRNVGLAAARGDYVLFCDNDDWLGPRALQRMVSMARRTEADVLLPKIVGHRRQTPRAIFRANLDDAVLGKDPLMLALTTHKLFRRAFLEAHNLRFPEGRRRLEDHVFVVEAYFLARVISVLADYPCYHRTRRDDDGNAAYQKWEADYYFRFVAEVIDVIDAHTEPGELRNELLERPYTAEMLGKLTGRRLQAWDDETRQQIFDVVRGLAVERFPTNFHDRLGIAQRAHAEALLSNRLDRMTDVAARVASAKATARLRALRPTERGWVAEIEAELRHEDGSPILLTPSAGGWSIDPRLIPPELAAARYDLEQIQRGYVDVVLRHSVSDIEWYAETAILPALVELDGDPRGAHRLVFRGTVEIDPATLACGRPLQPGSWRVVLHIDALGIFRMAPLAGQTAATLPSRALFVAVPSVVRPFLTRGKDALAFKVTRPRTPKAVAALREIRNVEVTPGGDLVGTITLAPSRGASPVDCRVILAGVGAAVPRRFGRLNGSAVGHMLADRLTAKS